MNLPRIRFAHLPTPIEPLPRLSAALGGVRLLVKRDDQTGLAFGGNKTRKLEFVLAEALANGARTLVTVGAAQSNHCRQTAALAARYGLGCILVLSGEPPVERSGNLLLDGLFGAEVAWCRPEERGAALKAAFDRAWEEGRRPYLIPLGASNATGAAAYVAAFDEMLEQMGSHLPDWIVLASSSGGTQAGLALGAALRKFNGRVLGISVDHAAHDLQETVAHLARETAGRMDLPVALRPEDVLVNDEYLGGGYGVFGEAEREAVQLFARTEGLLLDPVYTARAAAGLLGLARAGLFQAGESVLFWHTGGTPALFAEAYQRDLQPPEPA